MARILIVEDNLQYARLLADLCKEKGFEVDVSGNADEALRMLDIEDYEAALVDQWMPVMNGIQMISRMRKKGVSIGVILLTALVPYEVEDKIDGLDIWKVIEKGCNETELIESINEAVEFTRMNKDVESARVDALDLQDGID